ncbi:MAG: hypothetical protein OXP68_13020 [Anaerolineaceae bacterium]|nr:hypothetical protein [Anaerolineaceae bacterium]MDE0328954.1 hypothetical protein [Anaerolineaceae bacterium]
MSEPQFVNTSANMVQLVDNIVDGYKMGPIRALAQEPVQNALDARRSGKVFVEYRLLRRETNSGQSCHTLTVTDWGTFGLKGPILPPGDLDSNGNRRDHNWADFEAQGFTKEDEDALGSRGQGKAAFLYHSDVPSDFRSMVILYDTLLENGEYRLGMRICRPGDKVFSPPLLDAKARQAIQQDSYNFGGIDIPLALEPLREIGTRIVVPFLGQDALEAFRDGELAGWLQRCWWRAIQTKKLDIRVVDENGNSTTIDIPRWWQDLPRKTGQPAQLIKGRNGTALMMWEDQLIHQGRLKVKRLVLFHDDALTDDEINGELREHPEYAGIQLLRKQQWIETLGVRGEFWEEIPKDKQAGFRGFVEFDRDSDKELRKIENSQHDGFRRKDGGHKRAIRSWLKEKVHHFSTQMEWIEDTTVDEKDATEIERKVGKRIAGTFLVPNYRHGSNSSFEKQEQWTCSLHLDYPRSGTTKVNYGDELKNLNVTVDFQSEESQAFAFDLLLTLTDSDGVRHTLLRKESELFHSNYICRCKDWQVLQGRGNLNRRQMSCPHPGVYTLRAEVYVGGVPVAESARRLYVACEPPPPPPQKPQTLSISVVNLDDPNQLRVRSGDRLLAQISVTNRSIEDFEGFVVASLNGETLVSDASVSLAGTLAGDSPLRESAWFGEICLVLKGDVKRTLDEVAKPFTSEPGRVELRADLYAREDREMQASLSHAKKVIWFENEPSATDSDLPFLIKSTNNHRCPAMWWLQGEGDSHTLFYRKEYPLRTALKQASVEVYTEEIVFNGLLDWALRPVEHGDASNLSQMRDMQLEGIGIALHDDYQRRLDELESLAISTDSSSLEISQKIRETVALMQRILRERVA